MHPRSSCRQLKQLQLELCLDQPGPRHREKYCFPHSLQHWPAVVAVVQVSVGFVWHNVVHCLEHASYSHFPADRSRLEIAVSISTLHQQRIWRGAFGLDLLEWWLKIHHWFCCLYAQICIWVSDNGPRKIMMAITYLFIFTDCFQLSKVPTSIKMISIDHNEYETAINNDQWSDKYQSK